MALLPSVAASSPNSVISPRVGFSDNRMSLSRLVFPAPEGPVRN
jgi:hypothetical protein